MTKRLKVTINIEYFMRLFHGLRVCNFYLGSYII